MLAILHTGVILFKAVRERFPKVKLLKKL